MGKNPVIGFSRPQDFNDTAAAIAESKRRDHAGHPGGRNTMAPPHLRWGKVVTAWADGDLNTVTIRPCFADGTAIPGVKTDGTHDHKIYIRWPADTDPGDMSAILTADLLLPWVPFGVELEEHSGLLFTLAADDIKVKVSENDTVADFLENKLEAGDNIDLTINDEGAEETITIGAADAIKVKVSENDTVADFLENKLVAGDYLDLTVNNEGAEETITVAVDLTEVSGYNGSNDQVLVHESGTLKWIDLATFACP